MVASVYRLTRDRDFLHSSHHLQLIHAYNVALSYTAWLGHFRDLLLTQRAIPHIDACHFSDEGMTFHKLFPCFFIQFSVHHFAFCRYRSSCVKEISKFLELILGLDLELHVCPCKNRAKSTIRGKAQKIKFAPLLQINFSSGDQEEVENIDIIATIRTDHSAITLHLNGIKFQPPTHPLLGHRK